MEPKRQNNDINAIQEIRQLFNQLRSNLSRKEISRIRYKLNKNKNEVDYNSLKEKEQKDEMKKRTNEEKKELKNIYKYLKNISMHLKNLKRHFKKHFKKLQKLLNYQFGLDYLFNEHNKKNYISNNAFKDARKLLNERKSNLLRKEKNEIRKKLNKNKADYNSLKEKEQVGSLTNEEKRELKNIDRFLKNFKNDLEELQKYQHNIIYGLGYLFNEFDEVDYYELKEVKSTFNGSYVLYESE